MQVVNLTCECQIDVVKQVPARVDPLEAATAQEPPQLAWDAVRLRRRLQDFALRAIRSIGAPVTASVLGEDPGRRTADQATAWPVFFAMHINDRALARARGWRPESRCPRVYFHAAGPA